ncbi:MAG: hypothetical protein ACKV0T_18590, partial [Planctomycetales bacterium]
DKTQFAVIDAKLRDTTKARTIELAQWESAADVVLMTLTDDNPYAQQSDFVVSRIDWGGSLYGSAPLLRVEADPDYVGDGSGWKVIADRVAYAQSGDFPVALTVQGSGGNYVESTSTTFSVGASPTSRVSRLPSTTPAAGDATSFDVSWGGDAFASAYSVYVSDNGGEYIPLLTKTPQTSFQFTQGKPGHTYSFYSVAYDALGHEQPQPPAPQAVTTVETLSAFTRLAGLEGYYFVDGQVSQILRNGHQLTLVGPSGQVLPGTLAGGTDVVADGRRGLWDRADGSIAFDDGTVWQGVRQIAGRWLTDDGQETGITQLGTDLRLTVPGLGSSTGRFVSATELVATDWNNLTGRLTANGARIRWSNGDVWELIPDLDGPFANVAAKPLRIEQQGTVLLFVNALGQTSTGQFVGQNQVVATDWGGIRGTLSGSTIRWNNGTVWTQRALSADQPDLGGVWQTSVNGQGTRILQTDNQLTFINRTGGVSTGRFVSANEVVADAWNSRGVIVGNSLTWSSNGIIWSKLPRLGGSYMDADGQVLTVNQLERSLTLTTSQGAVSHGTLLGAITFVETDGARRAGAIAGSTLTFGSSGASWTLLPDLRGSWSMGSGGAAGVTYVVQSAESLLLVDATGEILTGRLVSPTQARLTRKGAPTAPSIELAITPGRQLDFGGGIVWDKTRPDGLDAVYADVNLWPLV